MSRSYKKTPISKYGGYGGKDGKKFARRKWRRSIDNNISQRSYYKRKYESWEINDYVSRWTKEDAIDYYNRYKKEEWFRKRYSSLDSYLEKTWYRYYRRK